MTDKSGECNNQAHTSKDRVLEYWLCWLLLVVLTFQQRPSRGELAIVHYWSHTIYSATAHTYPISLLIRYSYIHWVQKSFNHRKAIYYCVFTLPLFTFLVFYLLYLWLRQGILSYCQQFITYWSILTKVPGSQSHFDGDRFKNLWLEWSVSHHCFTMNTVESQLNQTHQKTPKMRMLVNNFAESYNSNLSLES